MQTTAQPTRATTPTATQPGYFFVRGHPRSGTNWVSNLLNLHLLHSSNLTLYISACLVLFLFIFLLTFLGDLLSHIFL